MTTAFATCGEYAAAIAESGLVGPDDRQRLAGFMKESPGAGPKELVAFLVGRGMLTRFQADYVIEGRTAELTLASYS